MLTKISSDKNIELAYQWLCKARKDSHHNNDIWHLRFHWETLKRQIQQQLLNGDYHFSPCRAYKVNDESVGVWCAQDALVLKAMSLVLTECLTPEV